jgi:hypothetical protein
VIAAGTSENRSRSTRARWLASPFSKFFDLLDIDFLVHNYNLLFQFRLSTCLMSELRQTFGIEIKSAQFSCLDATGNWYSNWATISVKSIYLLFLYSSVKRSHHVRREGLEILTLIQKREEYTPLDFMKIWRSRINPKNT